MALSKQEKERRKLERRQKKWDEAHKIIDGIDHKICNDCDSYFPATGDYFYLNTKNSIDGLYPYCITCAKIQADNWAANNYERRLELKRNNNKAPQARINQRENTRRKRANGYYDEFFKKHPEKLKEYRDRRMSNKEHTISTKEWVACKDYFNNACAYCGLLSEEHLVSRKGKIINMDLHKEHVIDSGANDLSNCIPSCRDCNSSKWKFPFDDWFNVDNPVFTDKRLAKIYTWLDNDYKRFIDSESSITGGKNENSIQ